MQPAIDVRDLRKRYGRLVAVDGVSLEVAAGEVLALLGPNGAGKTTTVECIEGYREPDDGRVRVLGLDPRRQRAALAPALGVMLQEGGAWQAASPLEMVRLYARFHREPADPRALLERAGLDERALGTRYRMLSGGQKQRLNLALALVGRPRVVTLDEPTAGLDPEARRRVWELVRELRDDGVAVLLTTHLLDEAERLADRVAVMDHGRLLACDRPQALLAGGGRVVVRTPARIDPAELSAAVGAPVVAEGNGRWVVEAGAEGVPAVASWFAARGLELTEVSAASGGLEEVYLRLTGGGVAGRATADGRAGAEAAATAPPSDVAGPPAEAEPEPAGRTRQRSPAAPADDSGVRASGDGSAAAAGPLPRPAPAWRRVAAMAGMELRLLARNGENLLVTLGIPVAMLVFFSVVDVLPTADRPAVDFLLPRVLTVAVMGTALVSLAISTGFERHYLVLKRLGATPLGRGQLVVAKALAVGVVVAVQTAVLLGVAVALGWPAQPEGAATWSLPPLWLALGALAFAGLGLLLAGTLRATLTLALSNTLFAALLLASGLLFPMDELPEAVAGPAGLLPSAALARLLDASVSGLTPPVGAALVLAGWALVLPLLAAWRFRWE